MKTVYTTVCCLILGISTFAQSYEGDVHAAPAKTRTYTEHELQAPKDGVIMKKGRVFVVKGGSEQSIFETMTMLDGTKILADGTYVKLDGTKGKLREGEQILFNGELHSAPPQHFITMKNGKMMVINDTIQILMDRELTLENGHKVYPQGYMINEGKKVMINNGDRINMSGNWMEPEAVAPYSSKPSEEITAK